MQHSPMMKTLGMITWAVTAIASINMLTALYGCDIFAWMMINMPGLVLPMIWIVGLSGIISLAFLIKGVMGCASCGACPCTCPKF